MGHSLWKTAYINQALAPLLQYSGACLTWCAIYPGSAAESSAAMYVDLWHRHNVCTLPLRVVFGPVLLPCEALLVRDSGQGCRASNCQLVGALQAGPQPHIIYWQGLFRWQEDRSKHRLQPLGVARCDACCLQVPLDCKSDITTLQGCAANMLQGTRWMQDAAVKEGAAYFLCAERTCHLQWHAAHHDCRLQRPNGCGISSAKA